MPSKEYLLKNAIIINEGKSFKGHLIIKDGKIASILNDGQHPGDTLSIEAETFELDGLWLMPGVIDDQVHFREPGLTHKEDLTSGSRAAAAGGITSFMEMPNTLPQTTTQELLEKKFRLGQEKSLVNYSFYMGATNDNIEELQATDRNNVCGIKVFMGSSTGNMLVDRSESLKRIFSISKIPVAVHCEDETVIRTNLANARRFYGDAIPMRHHPAIRNHEACETSSRLAISLADRYGTRLHLLHLSTANELKLLDNTTPPGQKQITAEVCTHHLWFTENDYEEKGPWIKWNPAVKGITDREALIEALLSGHIDIVATDHAPHTMEEKLKPYEACPSGGPMVQHSLPLMLEFYHQGRLTRERITELMCHNPAICFGIKNRGFIREGYAADLVVVNPDQSRLVSKDTLFYKCGWSPLEGITLDSSVIYTFVNGNLVYEKGIVHDTIKGQALQFSR